MITHNRLEYLKKALPSVLAQKDVEFRLHLWDNGSEQEVVDWIENQDDKRIIMYFSQENKNLADITSYVFLGSNSEFVGKVDADMIIPPDWASRLIAKHKENQYGFLGGFHFRPEDLKGITPITINGIWEKHHIGGQFIIRREDFKGYKGEGVHGLSEYQFEMGFINGYLWDPILWVDHMEDARSLHYIDTPEYNDYKLKTRGLSLADYQKTISDQNYLRENTK